MASSDVTVVFRQLATMIEAGISLVKSLAALERQSDGKGIKQMLHLIRIDVESGLSFSKALGKHPLLVSDYVVSMVYAGEQGIGLAPVLTRVSNQLDADEQLRSKVTHLFTYPLVVGGFSLLIIFFLVVVVAPIFAKVYGQLGVILPLPTRILLGTSHLVRDYALLWIALIAGTIGFFSYFRKKGWHRKVGQFLMMKLPILGNLSEKVAIAKFVRAFGSLLSCHVNILMALHVVSKMVKHPKVSEVIASIRATVQGGGTVTSAFEASGIFSSMVLQMTHVGEESGSLGPVLEKCATALEQDIETTSKRILVVLEPMLTLGLSSVIGFIALAIYMPMFDLMGHVGQ